MFSLAGKFEIKGCESDCECLKEGAGKRHIHIEGIFAHSAELHIDVIVVVLVYQLEILDTGFVHSPVEIQYERLHLCKKSKKLGAILTLVPLRRLIEEEHHMLDVTDLKLLLDRMLRLKKCAHIKEMNWIKSQMLFIWGYLHLQDATCADCLTNLRLATEPSCDEALCSPAHWSRTGHSRADTEDCL
jgi:hypothetical protein